MANKLKEKIKERLDWCNKRLDLLRLAKETHSSTERSWAYIGGRIRELENEKAFLEGLIKLSDS